MSLITARRVGLVAAAAVIFRSGRPVAPPERAKADAVVRAAAALYEGIRVEKLANGLTVYLKPVPGSPVVSTMVAYKVGSADENLDATGLSHYLEHLMFKGTEKLLPGDIDRMTQRNGGQKNPPPPRAQNRLSIHLAPPPWEG